MKNDIVEYIGKYLEFKKVKDEHIFLAKHIYAHNIPS